MTTFGPPLIGEAAKTINALLDKTLQGTGLTQDQWVALRIAARNGSEGDLLAMVEHGLLPDPAALVAALAARGLLDGGQLSQAGRELVAAVQARAAATTGPMWQGLAPDDVDATERTLNTLIERGRALLSS